MSNLEINARYLDERMRFDDCGISSAAILDSSIGLAEKHGVDSRFITIKGDSEPDELVPGVTYTFFGQFRNYENRHSGKRDKQLWFTSFRTLLVHDEQGVVTYLASVGKGLGLGPATAKRAWNEWQGDAVKHIREYPLDLCDIARISPSQAEEISQRLKQMQLTEQTMIDLTSLLHGRGFPKSLPRKCIKAWGVLAGDIVRKDPYRLMQFRGCGFGLCDHLYLELGLDPLRLRRQALRGWYEIASDSSGDTWFPAARVERAIAQLGAKSEPARAVQLGLRLGRRSISHYGALANTQADSSGHLTELAKFPRHWLAEGRKAEQERSLADYVVSGLRESPTGWLWPDVSQLEIDAHQKSVLAKATGANIGVLGGSPGTGKTYCVAQLVKAILHNGKVLPHEIGIGAPTGKAAVRVTENLVAAGVRLSARTWHSLLGVSEQNAESGEFGFRFTERNPWGFKVLIGDESSMNDCSLMRAIFAARPRGCHLLLVGDVNQLPPVGHGAPLRDMLLAGVPQGELTEIKRNSGGIVEACAAIRDDRRWEPGDNLQLIESTGAPSQLATVEDVLAEMSGLDPTWGAQVLTAVNLRSSLSRKMVNKTLQPILNRHPGPVGQLRTEDKVVCTKNSYYSVHETDSGEAEADQDGRVYVANGELSKIIEVDNKRIVASLSNPNRTIVIPRGKSDGESSGCNFELAYALSCHKSQGSEWPVVIVLLDEYPGAKSICDRSWIYTAISRAKHKCYLVGKRCVADAMCRRNNITRRKTFLRELIGLGCVERQLEAI